MMMSDDDDAEPQLNVLKDYYLLDAADQPVCFSVLPFQFKDTDEVPECKTSVFLWGTANPGIKVYKKVVAWKLGLEGKQPEIAVLSAEGSLISLAKPNNSYEETIRTILITVQMLYFLRRKPEEPEKNLWIHLRKVFDKFDVRPSEDDIRNHRSLVKQFAEKDSILAKSQILRAFIEERSRKKISEVGSDNVEIKESFIADDGDIEEMIVSDEEEEEDLFDSICAICDNGGDLLCCDGPCMRSFHAKIGTGEDSYCDTLGYTKAEVEAMKNFLCKNCEYKQHQCFICGVLEPSKGPIAKVFLCNNATCGLFYHPKCVAQQLHPNNRNEALELEKKITDGFSFTCPTHWCFRCKSLEDRTQEHLQFAVCRRCPKSYHRKCLPREISFKDIEEEDIIKRAWELSKRILIYCLDHEIDSDIDTPVRNHIKFPRISSIEKPTKVLKKSTNMLFKKKKRTFSESVLDQPSKKPAKLPDKVRLQGEHARKIAVKSLSEQLVDKPDKKKVKLLEERTQPVPNMVKDASISSPKPAKEQEKQLPSSTTRKITQSSFPIVDNETEKRVLDLVEKEVSSLTLKDVSRKCLVPSTHAYSGRQIDRIIATGKLERSVQAVGAALKMLENGGSVNAAKAVCEPEVLRQLTKWHSKLRVYISPFIYGTRYSSFGRHFTKVEKLVEIVNKVHWYVEPGDTGFPDEEILRLLQKIHGPFWWKDELFLRRMIVNCKHSMIVDFCCGANDFSRLMKEKLDQVQKKCHFKNYDLIQPQNCFCFERRDWMTVQPKELPRGSQLIMGLNPPFGVKAALANKFIDKALTFKPKLVILIVPKETKRLDQKKTPYDLVWEDSDCLSGKAFYLPGSVDVNDKIVEGWNASAPPLYLWSRPDWTKKHRKVAEEHSHTSIGKIACHAEEGNLSDDFPVKKEAEPSDICTSRSGKQNTGKTSCHLKEANLSDDLPVRKQAEATNKQNTRSGKQKETVVNIACNVREASLSDDRPVKKQARSGEEKSKEANLSDNLPVKKQAEATFRQISRSGKEKEKGRDESKRSDDRSRKRTPDQVDSLPPEKQEEIAYEERRVIPRKKSIHQEERCGDGVNAHIEESKGGDSDMSISSPDTSNARNRTRSYSPFVPSEHSSDRTAHPDSYTSYLTTVPHVSMFKSVTYQGSYLASSDGYSNALEGKSDPTFYTNADDSSRKYSSSIKELTKRYAAAPTGNVYSLQSLGDDGSFCRRLSSEEWNTNSAEKNSVADVSCSRYGGQIGDGYQQTGIPPTTDADRQGHLRMHGGPSADDYLQISRYSLGSSGARYGQPALTSPSYGFSGTTAPRSSVMDKYAPGFLGPSGLGSLVMDKYAPGILGQSAPGSSVMDKYGPPLEETNYTTRGIDDVPRYGRDMPADPMSLEPPQFQYLRPGSSGRGPPYN